MKEKYKCFGDVLDVVVHHLKHGHRRDAAAVIDALPDEEIRDFAFFVCMHVERDLAVLGDTVREHTEEVARITAPNAN